MREDWNYQRIPHNLISQRLIRALSIHVEGLPDGAEWPTLICPTHGTSVQPAGDISQDYLERAAVLVTRSCHVTQFSSQSMVGRIIKYVVTLRAINLDLQRHFMQVTLTTPSQLTKAMLLE